MPRFLDLTCSKCGAEVSDLLVMKVPSRILHMEDDGVMEQVYRLRPKPPALEKNMAVVFRDKNGKIRYPGRNDTPTPKGYERVVIPPSQMDQFCRDNKVLHEDSNFDRGSGRAFDTDKPEPKLPSERERYERFRRSTQGVF
jgi:hypothetical protein